MILIIRIIAEDRIIQRVFMLVRIGTSVLVLAEYTDLIIVTMYRHIDRIIFLLHRRDIMLPTLREFIREVILLCIMAPLIQIFIIRMALTEELARQVVMEDIN